MDTVAICYACCSCPAKSEVHFLNKGKMCVFTLIWALNNIHKALHRMLCAASLWMWLAPHISAVFTERCNFCMIWVALIHINPYFIIEYIYNYDMVPLFGIYSHSKILTFFQAQKIIREFSLNIKIQVFNWLVSQRKLPK